ncbi:type II toxin-antitoxin system HicA family toxin [Nitrosomonas communis]|uniref:type II toxin-antitoxin system HicA family toxin n=1 Tax=Nitrosomonas communis TaxID=44574 RepID=UPI0026EFAC13|nr:type II toxin-antitoxin system HicA family toxin [Nitrosomonas communis]MCO6427124.1 type II toxin-antitoxin system HicA family toxin [Nitrosomonas communis]
MSGAHPPLTCKDVKKILTSLGFTPRPQKGTSHEQWVKVENGKLFKVTVDCPKSPFSQDLIASMAKQVGVSKKAFYAALDTK